MPSVQPEDEAIRKALTVAFVSGCLFAVSGDHGQKAGRRVSPAIIVSPLFIFSEKKESPS